MKNSIWKSLIFFFNFIGIILAFCGILIATISLNGFTDLALFSYVIRILWGFFQVLFNVIIFFTSIFPFSLDLLAIILSIEIAISIICLVLLLDFSQIKGWRYKFLIFGGIFNVALICIGLGIFDANLINAKTIWIFGGLLVEPLSSLTGSIPIIIGAAFMTTNIFILFSIRKNNSS